MCYYEIAKWEIRDKQKSPKKYNELNYYSDAFSWIYLNYLDM